MITIEDCKAFCDAPSNQVEEFARRESLPMVHACARAHELTAHNSPTTPKESAMMSMQARDMFPPRQGKTYPLRSYPTNSPRAMARLAVLALLADGQLDECELKTLERRGAFATLGISRQDFVEVLYDFCADVARLSENSRGYRLSPPLLKALFAEVDDRAAKERLLKLIASIISSDGHFSDGEEKLFLGALHAWGGSLRKERPQGGFALRRRTMTMEHVAG